MAGDGKKSRRLRSLSDSALDAACGGGLYNLIFGDGYEDRVNLIAKGRSTEPHLNDAWRQAANLHFAELSKLKPSSRTWSEQDWRVGFAAANCAVDGTSCPADLQAGGF